MPWHVEIKGSMKVSKNTERNGVCRREMGFIDQVSKYMENNGLCIRSMGFTE